MEKKKKKVNHNHKHTSTPARSSAEVVLHVKKGTGIWLQDS